jgi:hypothetical protein
MKISDRRGPDAPHLLGDRQRPGAAGRTVVGGVVDRVAVDGGCADSAVEVRLDGDVFVPQRRVGAIDTGDDVVRPVNRRLGGDVHSRRRRELEGRGDTKRPS